MNHSRKAPIQATSCGYRNPSSDTDANDLPWHRRGDNVPERRDERDEIGRAIAACVEDDDRDASGGDVLLIGEISIDRDQDGEPGLAHKA